MSSSSLRVLLRIATSWIAIGSLAMSQAPVPTQVRVHFIRVLGTPFGTSATPGPAADWVDPAVPTTGNPSLAQKLNTIVGVANSILTASTTISPQAASIALQLTPTSTSGAQDLVDPDFPFSYFTVTLGPPNSNAWKDAMEAACEADPPRYKFETNAINVYLCDSINGNTLGGICSFPISSTTFSGAPDEDDIVFISNTTQGVTLQSRLNFYGITLAHEIGHYFGLIHTHNDQFIPSVIGGTPLGGPSSAPGTCGAPTGIGTGDLVSDTPYDPWPVLVPQSIAGLTAFYSNVGGATCTGDIQTLQTNAMSYYYSDATWIPSGIGLTNGQRLRMYSFLFGVRSKVRVAVPSPTITSVSPSISDYSNQLNTIDISGSNLPIGGGTAGIDMTLGRLRCFGAPTCFLETDSSLYLPQALSDVNPGTLIRAVVPSPLPPGNHTITLRRGQNVVASLANALRITPFLESSVSPSGQLTLSMTTANPNTPLFIAAEVPSLFPYSTMNPAPFTSFGNTSVTGYDYYLFLNPANLNIVLVNGTGWGGPSAGGFTSPLGPFSLAPFLSGTRFFVQGIELVPTPTGGFGTFTNVLSIGVP